MNIESLCIMKMKNIAYGNFINNCTQLYIKWPSYSLIVGNCLIAKKIDPIQKNENINMPFH